MLNFAADLLDKPCTKLVDKVLAVLKSTLKIPYFY